MLVVSPHPDDETLGPGGLIAMQRSRNLAVTLLAVTDGEAAYPGEPDLGLRRRIEQMRAADALGVANDSIIRLGLRDSDVAQSIGLLTDRIEAVLRPETLLVSPWVRDPHPDHEACGRAAQLAAWRTGARLISYFFWTWHHFRPECLQGLPLRRLILSQEAQSRREVALGFHASQLHREDGAQILPDILLVPARRPFETFVVHCDESYSPTESL